MLPQPKFRSGMIIFVVALNKLPNLKDSHLSADMYNCAEFPILKM